MEFVINFYDHSINRFEKLRVMNVCSERFASSLAASTLLWIYQIIATKASQMENKVFSSTTSWSYSEERLAFIQLDTLLNIYC